MQIFVKTRACSFVATAMRRERGRGRVDVGVVVVG